MNKLGMKKNESGKILGQIFACVTDNKYETISIHADDSFVTVQWSGAGILAVEHELLPKVAPGTEIRARGASLYTIKEGKVVSEEVWGKWL
jgi:DUF971 family protein